jgi:hypothetical protein
MVLSATGREVTWAGPAGIRPEAMESFFNIHEIVGDRRQFFFAMITAMDAAWLSARHEVGEEKKKRELGAKREAKFK